MFDMAIPAIRVSISSINRFCPDGIGHMKVIYSISFTGKTRSDRGFDLEKVGVNNAIECLKK
jgi:hypothetical protein